MDGDSYEKCAVSIQFDPNTKKLWQELHYPYGNYTSFFRYNFRDCFFSSSHNVVVAKRDLVQVVIVGLFVFLLHPLFLAKLKSCILYCMYSLRPSDQ